MVNTMYVERSRNVDHFLFGSPASSYVVVQDKSVMSLLASPLRR